MTDTANLALPLIEGSQAQKHVTHNEALAALDLIVQLAVVSRQASAPPSTPAEGARWIVAASPSGAWAGHAGAIAAWQDGGWVFYPPRAGWLACVLDENALVVFNGSAWGPAMAAAPLDALAANGLQLNGGMEVAQETAGAAQALAATGSLQTVYVLDQAFAMLRGSFAMTAQQVSDAPPGYAKSLKLTVTTAQASLGTSDEASIGFPIEGTRLSRLAFGNAAAQPISLAFWVKAHRAGTYSGSLRNAARNRAFAFSFAVNVADVWEYKTITVPAGDTTGTWASDAGLGLLVTLCVAAGTGRAGSAGAWSAADYVGASGAVNGVAATSDTFQVTGLVVLPGLDLPSASRAPLLMRPFAQELSACERYYEKSYAMAIAPGTASQSAGASAVLGPSASVAPSGRSVIFRTMKRAAPTITAYSPVTGASSKARDDTNAADVNATADLIAPGGFRWFATPSASGAVALSLHFVAQARL